jgi:hypothetical protein
MLLGSSSDILFRGRGVKVGGRSFGGCLRLLQMAFSWRRKIGWTSLLRVAIRGLGVFITLLVCRETLFQ